MKLEAVRVLAINSILISRLSLFIESLLGVQ